MISMVMKLAKPKSGGTEVAGSLAIAAPGASYDVDFLPGLQKPRRIVFLLNVNAPGGE